MHARAAVLLALALGASATDCPTYPCECGDQPGKCIVVGSTGEGGIANKGGVPAQCGNQPVCRVHGGDVAALAPSSGEEPTPPVVRHAIEQASRRWRGGRRGERAVKC
jgi:hypothetical protein